MAACPADPASSISKSPQAKGGFLLKRGAGNPPDGSARKTHPRVVDWFFAKLKTSGLSHSSSSLGLKLGPNVRAKCACDSTRTCSSCADGSQRDDPTGNIKLVMSECSESSSESRLSRPSMDSERRPRRPSKLSAMRAAKSLLARSDLKSGASDLSASVPGSDLVENPLQRLEQRLSSASSGTIPETIPVRRRFSFTTKRTSTDAEADLHGGRGPDEYDEDDEDDDEGKDENDGEIRKYAAWATEIQQATGTSSSESGGEESVPSAPWFGNFGDSRCGKVGSSEGEEAVSAEEVVEVEGIDRDAEEQVLDVDGEDGDRGDEVSSGRSSWDRPVIRGEGRVLCRLGRKASQYRSSSSYTSTSTSAATRARKTTTTKLSIRRSPLSFKLASSKNSSSSSSSPLSASPGSGISWRPRQDRARGFGGSASLLNVKAGVPHRRPRPEFLLRPRSFSRLHSTGGEKPWYGFDVSESSSDWEDSESDEERGSVQ